MTKKEMLEMASIVKGMLTASEEEGETTVTTTRKAGLFRVTEKGYITCNDSEANQGRYPLQFSPHQAQYLLENSKAVLNELAKHVEKANTVRIAYQSTASKKNYSSYQKRY